MPTQRSIDIVIRMREMFFDREAVIEAVGRASAKTLSKAGAYIQRRAKSSIRKRKRVSKPGEPPSSHVGTLRNRIYFSFDPPTRSVVVGPTPMGSVGIVPPTLEFGGPAPRRKNPRRRERELGGAGEIRTGRPGLSHDQEEPRRETGHLRPAANGGPGGPGQPAQRGTLRAGIHRRQPHRAPPVHGPGPREGNAQPAGAVGWFREMNMLEKGDNQCRNA